jgi:hypothetical protein
MRESAMVCESKYWAAESTKHIEVGRLSGQRHGGGRERGFAIESGASQASASEKMSDRFQISIRLLKSYDLKI